MDQDRAAGDAPTLPPKYPSHSETIGSCRLIRKLGEGGMGEVWLAEQQHPVRRKVALKIIKLGMDTREVVARFAAEQQALALMDHPSIARMFDAGSTPEGRPYFVMEYVAGVPLKEYCDIARLTIRQRLELFTQVCSAVQHAHHKAIIHRDLKPSNVLVADTERGPVPKVIDFGIAKAVVTPLVDRTMMTQAGGTLGTPEYMSPEQLDPAAVDIDTRADIYALGVILYELLAGAHPVDTKSATSLDEIRQRIRTQDPVRPSTRLQRLGVDAEQIAQRRHADVAGLTRSLRGDLDWIVLKTLEKDRNRRYGSPTDLANDIQRHLTNQPVLARPPSAPYRAGRFVRRHRFGFAISCAAALLLVGFALTMAVLASRLARERDRAAQEAQSKERIAAFLQDLFATSTPERARGRVVTVREVLENGVEKIKDVPTDQAAVRADLLGTMGSAFESLGIYDKAGSLFAEELAIARSINGDDARVTAAMRHLGHFYASQGRYAESAAIIEQARAIATAADDDESRVAAERALAATYTRQGRLEDASKLYESLLAHARGHSGSSADDTLATLNNLAILYQRLGRVEEAAALDEEVVATRRRTLGADHPLTIMSINNLAYRYTALARYEPARALLTEAITTGERVYGPDHPQLAIVVHSLGELELAAGTYGAAIAHFTRALAIYRRQTSPQFMPQALYQLAQANARLGKTEAAIDFLQQALQAGYKPKPSVAEDPHFARVRSDPRFKKWELAPR